MYYLKVSWIIFILGVVFMIQCDGEPPQTESTEQIQNQKNGEDEQQSRRHEEGREDDAAPGINGGYEVEVVDDRNELIENMREFLNKLDEELEEKADTDDMEIFEQVQNDQFELNQMISEAENTDEEAWDEIKEAIQKTYVRIAVDYNERARPEEAHGGKGVWLLRNLG